MTHEGTPTGAQEPVEEVKIPDGERWLNLLGYGHLKGTSSGWYLVNGEAVKEEDFRKLGIEGEPVPVEEFDRLCGPHVRPVFSAIESMDPADPARELDIEATRALLEVYFPQAAEGK